MHCFIDSVRKASMHIFPIKYLYDTTKQQNVYEGNETKIFAK